MGPDEFVTRQELNLVLRLLLAKDEQNSELISRLIAILASKSTLRAEEFQSLVAEVEASRYGRSVREAEVTLRKFLAVRDSF